MPLGLPRQELAGVPLLYELRQHQEGDLGQPSADLNRGAQTFVAVRRRHADVDDRQIWNLTLDRRHKMDGVARCPSTTSIPSSVKRRAIPSRSKTLSSPITTRTGSQLPLSSARRPG